MMKRFVIFAFSFLVACAFVRADETPVAQEVRLGDVECRAGTTITVPIEVENLKNVASVFTMITYDPLVLVFQKAEQASGMREIFTEFIVSEETGAVKILSYGTNNCAQVTGELAYLTFAVREGSEGLYSDLSLAQVSVNEKTMTADLTVVNPLKVKSGMLRVMAAAAESEIEIESEVAFSEEDKTALKELLAIGSDVAKVVVQGEQAAVELGLDLGIKPRMTTESGVATAVFELPTLEVVDFDVETRQIRAKITPPEGAEITQNIVTGIIHVYGSDVFTDKMTKIADLDVDITDYLKSETKGEIVLTFQFGSKTFFRVKAGRVTAETIEITQ